MDAAYHRPDSDAAYGVNAIDTIAIAPISDRRDLFQETARRRGLSPLVIEKDFWVCWILKRIIELPEVGCNLIFKGGTSLSKVYRLIDRFSEDIDLSLRRDYLGYGETNDPERAASKTQQQKLVQTLRDKCRSVVQNEVRTALIGAIEQHLGTGNWSLKSDPDDRNTLNFAYPTTIISATSGTPYIRGLIKLELGAGSDPYPVGEHPIRSYAAEEFPGLFTAPSFNVTVMEAERTFWEKATLLHAEYHRPEDKPTPLRLSRHYYDLMQLGGSVIGERAIADQALLARVAAHKSVYFASKWACYETARPGSFHILPSSRRQKEVERDYVGMRDMFFGRFPTVDELLAAAADLEHRINRSA